MNLDAEEKTLQVRLIDFEGAIVGTGTMAADPLAANGHISHFLDQFNWDEPTPDLTHFQGVLEVVPSNGQVVATALRLSSGNPRSWRESPHGLPRTAMRQTVSLQDGILPSTGATVVWSLVVVLLLAAGSPPLQACDGGTAVPDPGNNPGLVEDCKVLLALRDELAGTGSLNWDTQLAMTRWEGIHVSGSPSRGTGLDLDNITGEIPAQLSQLKTVEAFGSQQQSANGRDPGGTGPTITAMVVGPLEQS